MPNRVGHNTPSADDVASIVARINAIKTDLAAFCVDLSDEERVHQLRMRPGGEAIATTVAHLADTHALKLPGADTGELRNDLDLAARLAPLAIATNGLDRLVTGTIMQAEGETWWAATALYTALTRISDSDPALAAALKDVVAFFALGKRKKPGPPTTG